MSEKGQNLRFQTSPLLLGLQISRPVFLALALLGFVLIGDTSNKKVLVLGGYGKNDLRKIRDDRTYVATIFSFDFMTLDDYRKSQTTEDKNIKGR